MAVGKALSKAERDRIIYLATTHKLNATIIAHRVGVSEGHAARIIRQHKKGMKNGTLPRNPVIA
jgi:transposase-like protein